MLVQTKHKVIKHKRNEYITSLLNINALIT